MKFKLAVAFAVLSFASVVHADDVFYDGSWWIVPSGSTLLGVTNSTNIAGPYSTLEYSFADGIGYEVSSSYFGYSGAVDFTISVTDLTFGWDGGGDPFFSASDNAGDSFYDAIDQSGSETFTGTDISQVLWSGPLFGGITSLTYTEDVVEPSTLPLLGLGLIALVALSRRKISCCG